MSSRRKYRITFHGVSIFNPYSHLGGICGSALPATAHSLPEYLYLKHKSSKKCFFLLLKWKIFSSEYFTCSPPRGQYPWGQNSAGKVRGQMQRRARLGTSAWEKIISKYFLNILQPALYILFGNNHNYHFHRRHLHQTLLLAEKNLNSFSAISTTNT